MNSKTDRLIRIPSPTAIVATYFVNLKEIKNNIYIVKINLSRKKKIIAEKKLQREYEIL